MKKIFIYLLSLVVVSLSTQAQNNETKLPTTTQEATPTQVDMFYPQIEESEKFEHWKSLGEGFLESDYEPSDYVWVMPANLGWAVFTAAGNAVCWPLKIIGNAAMGNFEVEMLVPPGRFSGKYFGVPGSYILGGPFWALERALWKWPRSLFKKEPMPEPIF
ncbi:hypothetical protein AAEX28_09990 [Lentisphaerota bacterium WC36G]|nr:hypothetical protein LJT99_12825 [Lentisphaerae bacterium WC36]